MAILNAEQLFAPSDYWKLTDEEKAEICNGCGTKGLGGWLVPDTLWGLSIVEACNIHDFMYKVGKRPYDKDSADRSFLNNMIRIINARSGILLRGLRRYRAMSYYSAVKDFGGPAFWNAKNLADNMKEIPL